MPNNLFEQALPPATGERFDDLLRCRNLHIERIVSSDQLSPQRYQQAQDEWVMLVQGEAELDVAGRRVTLRPGDHILIPAHTPHEVLRTTAGTLWLAVHLHPDGHTA